MDCFNFDLEARHDPPQDPQDTAPPDKRHTAGRKSRGVCKKQNKFRTAPQIRQLQTEFEAMQADMRCQVRINEMIIERLENVSPADLQSISDTATAESQELISLHLKIHNLVKDQNALFSEVQSLARSREVAEANLNEITKLHLDFREHLKTEAEKINMIEQACRASINQMHLRHQEHLKTEAEKLDRLQKEMHALQRGYNTERHDAILTNFDQFAKCFE